MAYKDLDMNEMVSLFSPFVNDAAAKKQFLLIPEIAGLHPRVTAAYEAVVSVRPAEDTDDPQLLEIIAAQKIADNRHDHLARCIALVLEARQERALAESPPDEATVAACSGAIAAVLPGGTGITNASYLAESGNTQRLERLLAEPDSAGTKTLLKSIPVKKGETALDTVTVWIQAGAELGQLETTKAARLAVLDGAPSLPQRVIQGARSQWIKVASLIVQTLDISDAPAELRAAVAHPLTSAADRAGLRAVRRSAGKPEAPAAPPAPAGPDNG